MPWSRTIAAFALTLCASAPAMACISPAMACLYDASRCDGEPDPANVAYRNGNYILAATLAEAKASGDALSFAARARIADAITREDGLCAECLLKAEATAQEAIKRAPDVADGYIQLAVAMGFRGRLLSAVEAQTEGVAEKGKRALDKALELDPANNWARAALGGWHLEVVRRAGPVAGSMLFGASKEEGLRLFRAALAAAPADLVMRYHYALSILALDQTEFAKEAQRELENRLKNSTDDALTRFTRRRAEELVKVLHNGNESEISATVRRFQGYSQSVDPAVAKQD